MNPNQPNPEPHEQAISFDDLEIVQAPEAKPNAPIKPAAEPAGVAFSEPAITYPATKPVPSPDIPAIPVPPPPPEVSVPEPKSEPVSEPVVESKVEAQEERPAETPQPKKAAVTPTVQPTTTPTPAVAVTEKTEVRKEIESILQSGLADMYVQMQPAERAAFSKAANETAGKLELLVTRFKATAKEVLRLIRAWLIKIPKINKYFLEQASKIKTDEILEMQRQQKKRSRLIQ